MRNRICGMSDKLKKNCFSKIRKWKEPRKDKASERVKRNNALQSELQYIGQIFRFSSKSHYISGDFLATGVSGDQGSPKLEHLGLARE